MHRFVVLPILYPFITASIVYGLIPIAELSLDAAIVCSIVWYLYSTLVWMFTYAFIIAFFKDRMSPMDSVIGFFNTLFVSVHMVAIVGMSFWMLDNSIFDSVPVGIGYYQLYISEFLPTAGNFVLQTGFLAVRPTPGSVLAGIWSLYGSIVGIITIVVLFGFVNRRLNPRFQTK